MTNVTNRIEFKRLLVRGACGALVATVAWTAMSTSASAAPAPVLQAPILAQGIVGLRQGAAGADVKAVQQALIAAGVVVPGGADGKFGPATRGAVVAFQAQRGIAQSGEVDSATASALGLSSPATPTGVTVFGGLQQGASGAAVKELQQKLTAAGVYVAGGADGQYGSATKTAVSNYQRWNGLNGSGIVDGKTATKLGLTGASALSDSGGSTPPPATSSNPYVGLKVGARGETVKELQRKLIAAGVNVRGGADGVFGNATKGALISFQKSHAQAQTGVVSGRDAEILTLGQPTTPATPPPASGNPYVGLTTGARGQLVKDLQQRLLDAGVAVRGGADGVFGNATKTALAAYQSANGLGVSGSVFEATAKKLGLGVAVPPPAPTPDPAPQPDSSNPYVGLKNGSQGANVKELQQALMDTGLVVRGGADGAFGNATKSALIAFQSVNGIAQTGVLTEKGAGILGLGTPKPPAPTGLVQTATGYPKKGESSERVRLLQVQLIAWNVTVIGGADGSFGNATTTALRDFQKTYGLTVSGVVTQATADKLGLSASTPTPPPSSANVQMKRFPLQGQCYFGDTWHAPRGGGRKHEGVDIIANEGNLLYAVVDGTITKQYWDFPGALAGNGLRVAQDDGTYFTYLHLSAFAPGLEVGTKVKAGDVIGFVGNTGSSATPHLHFEIHPGGGGAVNPYPFVKAMDECGNTTPQYQSSFAPAA